MRQQGADDAIEGLAFGSWLRSGVVPDDIITRLRSGQCGGSIGFKFNPNHDPVDGRFTSASGATGGARAYLGMTARGVGRIRPVGGGGTDRNGRHVPELFAPDPYALRNPAEALLHYVGGSGEDRNYYFNKVDTSQVKITDFAELSKIVAEGKPGVHHINNALGNYNGDQFGKAGNFSPANTVGGLKLRANGALVIAKDGSYRFNGTLHSDEDLYDFNVREGRSAQADSLTTFGRQLSGKAFKVHLIGSKPFSMRGRR